MRVIRDGIGNVYKDGQTLHSKVRVLQDDQGRVAVFDGKNQNPPIAVYEAGEVTFDRSGGCSTCQGWPARRSMQIVWERYERQAANAV